jgi:hypothetical protein
MKTLVNPPATFVACLGLLGGLALCLQADQLPNPTVTASARPYSASFTAVNLFDGANAEFATLGQLAISTPFTTNILDGTWVEMDFGAPVEFDRFVMRSRANNTTDIVTQSRLIVSDDPTFDATDRIFTFEPSGYNGAAIVHRFNSVVSGRYVRWEVTKGTGLNLGANQMWFLKTPAGQAPLPPPTVINSSTEYSTSYVRAYAVNDEFNLEYASLGATSSMFIDFDFGESKPISGFEFLNRWSDRVTTFDMYFSDTEDFSDVLATQSYTADPNGNMMNTATFDPVTARYVRLQATGYSGAVNTGVREIQFLTPAGQPPVIARAPTGGSRLLGDTITLSALVLGELPLSLQWYQDGMPVAGETNTTLVMTNLQVSQGGNYELVAANPNGSVTSAPPAELTVVNPPLDIESELRVWLRLNESSGTVAIDDSGFARDGTLNNFVGDDTQWVPGRIDGALRFNPDGSADDDVVLVGDDGGLDFSTSLEFTLAAWVNGSPSQDNGACIITKGTGAGGEQFAVDVFTNVFRFYVRNASAAATVLQSTNRPNNTWQHLVAVFSAPLNRMKLYLNAVEIMSGTPPATLFQTGHELAIGSRQAGAGNYDLNFNGAIDDARVYGRALTPADVTELYNQASLIPPTIVTEPAGGALLAYDVATLTVVADGSPPLSYQWLKNGALIPGATNATFQLSNVTTNDTGDYAVKVSNARGTTNSAPATYTVDDPAPALAEGLVLYLPFDETSGTDAFDSSGYDHNGMLQSFLETPWTAGLIGGALAFNPEGGAGDDVVLVNDDGMFDFSATLEFTLAAWVQGAPTQDSGAGLIAKGTGNGGEQYCLDIYNSTFRFYGWSGPGAAAVYQGPVGLNGAWQHVAGVFSASLNRVRLYVDGAVAASGAPPAALIQNGHEVSIGSRQAASGIYDLNFSGLMDDVRIYARALTPREIKTLAEYGARPQLTITRAGGQVTIAWPASVASFALESCDALGAAWTPVAGVVNNTITLPASGAKQFYRLKKVE